MIESLGRRLRVAFDRSARPDPDPRGASASVLHPEVDFVAYGEDCILSGRVRLASERLTDMLNDHDEYLLVDVLVERLDDARAVEVREVLVHRDELLLVHATGPRGSLARRTRSRLHALALQVGPYLVRGYLHALPGSDPLLAIRRRPAMVPLTEATIEYVAAGVRERRRVGALVVNRETLDWAAPATEEDADIPDLALEVETGPLVKDFTGEILTPIAESVA